MRLEEIYERAHDLLTRSLSSLRDAEAEEVCALFESFVGTANLQFEVKVSLQVRPIASSRDGTQELGVYLGKRLIGKLPEGMKDSLAEADIIELFGS